MKNSENWDWKKEPLRFAPAQQVLLCEMCWNVKHWMPHFNAEGKQIGRRNKCLRNGCQCGCTDRGPGRVRFTGEGLTEIPMDNALQITAKS